MELVWVKLIKLDWRFWWYLLYELRVCDSSITIAVVSLHQPLHFLKRRILSFGPQRIFYIGFCNKAAFQLIDIGEGFMCVELYFLSNVLSFLFQFKMCFEQSSKFIQSSLPEFREVWLSSADKVSIFMASWCDHLKEVAISYLSITIPVKVSEKQV